MLTQQFLALAHYNRWMNEKLVAVSSELTDEERKRDRGAPFRSIHGTWQHLLLADRVWLGRFNNRPESFTSLGQELYPDWEEFKRQRVLTDGAIDVFVGELSPEKLAGNLRYMSLVNPSPKSTPMLMAVTHLFQHQVHHRGQLTTLLEQAGLEFGVTDLLGMPGMITDA